MNHLASYLKSDSVNLSPREVLQASPGVLLGVTPGAVDVLNTLQIDTVFDLASSRQFANAELLVQASADPTNYLARFGAVPADVLDSSAMSIPISDLQHESTAILRGISSARATEIENELDVRTVRDLAKWPAYSAAKSLLRSECFPEAVPGFDPEAPADLLPRSGKYPTERVFYETLLIDEIEEDPSQLEDIDAAGPVDLLPAVDADFGFKRPAIGALLTFSQSWFAQGVALGQLLHSVALAPGESTRIAVYDWSRRTRGVRGETVTQTESLSNSTQHSRALSEVTNAVATEAQMGFSRTASESTAAQGGGGLGFSLGPLTIGATGSGATTSTEATSFSSSFGRREIAADYSQKVVDRTQQNANSVRNRRASVVQEISQSEHEEVSTRVITNYNHMHALSVQYYEVVQIYRVVVQLSDVERLLYIPMKLVDFRKQDDAGRFAFVEKYRQVLARAALNEAVRSMLTTEYGVVEIIPETPKVSITDVLRPSVVAAGNLMASGAADEEDDTSGFQPLTITATVSPVVAAGLRATAPLLNVISKKGWNLEQINAISTLMGRTLLKDDKDSIFLPDDVAVSGLSLPDLEPRQIRVHRRSTSSPLTRSNVSEIDFETAIPITDLDQIRVSVATEEDIETVLVLYLNHLGTRFALDVPVRVLRNRGLQPIVKFSGSRASGELVDHLEANKLYYSQTIYRSLDTATLALLLSPYKYGEQPVTQLIDPLPVTLAGNYLVFRMHAEATVAENQEEEKLTEWGEWLKDHGLANPQPREEIIPLPSGGVFAEAVLGRFNSAEKLDITRFWNWQDSPIPIQAPEIAAVQLGSRAQAEDLTPGDFSQPLVNIVNPTALPDPVGLSAVLGAIQQSNIFRDMSGLAQTIGLAQAGLTAASQGATAAGTQAGANLATAAQKEVEMFKAALAFAAAAMGVPVPAGGDSSNITNDGAKINHGKRLDDRKGTPSDGGSPSSSDGGSGAGSSGASSGDTGGTPVSPGPGSSAGHEAEAFRNTVHGPLGEPAGSFARGVSVESFRPPVFASFAEKDWDVIRTQVVSKAEEEYAKWGGGDPDDQLVESDTPGTRAKELLEDYWLPLGRPNWNAGHAWSAAFISHVMREADARPEFKGRWKHRAYISDAKANHGDFDKPIWAFDATTEAVQEGDIICRAREDSAATFDNIDDGSARDTHCDIVVNVDRAANEITVIGGNTSDSSSGKSNTVGKKTLDLDADGTVKSTGDANNDFFAIVRIV
jgi:hypothetical protein